MNCTPIMVKATLLVAQPLSYFFTKCKAIPSFYVLLVMMICTTHTHAQGSYSCSDFSVRVGAASPNTFDCYEVNVYVYIDYNGTATPPTSIDGYVFLTGDVVGDGVELISFSTIGSSSETPQTPNKFELGDTENTGTYAINPNPAFILTVETEPNVPFELTFETGGGITLEGSCAILPENITFDETPFDGPTISTCSSSPYDLELFVDENATIPFGDGIQIPVKIRDNTSPAASSIDIDRLDFKLDYVDVFENLEFVLDFTGTPLSSSNVAEGPDYYEGDIDLGQPLMLTNGARTLFSIKITPLPGQQPAAAGEVEFNFDYAQVQFPGTVPECCLAPTTDNSLVVGNELLPCGSAEPAFIHIDAPTIGCDEASFRVTIESDIPGQSLNVDDILLNISLDADGDWEIDETATLATLSAFCPYTTGQNCAQTGYPSDQCLDVNTGTETVIFGFCASDNNPPGFDIFDVVLTGTEGCINDLVIEVAEWENNSNDDCVIRVIKDFTVGEAYCAPVNTALVQKYCDAEGVAGVDICVTPASDGASSNCIGSFNISTNSSGIYTPPDCSGDPSYDLKPSKTGDIMCGVSTFDLIVIQKHILGVTPFDDPKDYVAADVNGSNSVTTLDLIVLRKVILAVDNSFPAGSWRFIPCNFDHDLGAPFTFPEYLEYSASEGYNACFEAIKIGDANCSCDATENLGQTPLAIRLSGGTETLNGHTPIKFNATNFTNVAGFQMALSYEEDSVSFQQLEAQSLAYVDTAIFAQNVSEPGILRLSWFDEGGSSQTLTFAQALFQLKFSKSTSGDIDLSDFSLDENTMAAQAYLTDGTIIPVVVVGGQSLGQVIGGMDIPAQQYSLQPEPNPFSTNLSLAIQAPTAGQSRLFVFDAAGRKVFEQPLWLEKGTTTVKIPDARQWQTGVYFYRLQTNEGFLSGKLVKK